MTRSSAIPIRSSSQGSLEAVSAAGAALVTTTFAESEVVVDGEVVSVVVATVASVAGVSVISIF